MVLPLVLYFRCFVADLAGRAACGGRARVVIHKMPLDRTSTKGPSPKRRSPSPPPRRSSTDDSSSDAEGQREPEPEPEPPRLAGRAQHLLGADERMPSPILALVEDDAGESEGADDVLVADLIDEALGVSPPGLPTSSRCAAS